MSENIILTCPHCGNKAPMKMLNRYEKSIIVPLKYNEEAQYTDIFEVFECPVCVNIQLYYTNWNSEEGYYEDYNIYDDGKVLFPFSETVSLYSLPRSVKESYESALKVRNLENTICVIALRRTLEMVCKDKGAVRGTLERKLNQLQEQGILPPLMGDISKVIKEFGNMAAHGDSVVFDRYIVDSMFRFTNKVLEYVYILPSEMKIAKLELEELTE